MKILVVDDEIMTTKIIQNRLKKIGYDVTICMDGKEAMEIVRHGTPDLIISDIMMPYMSGVELLTKIRYEITKPIMVMLISSLHKSEIINKVLDLGADDFISKPIKPKELILRIKKLETRWKKANGIALV